MKLQIDIEQSTYDKLLHQAYREKRKIAVILEQLVERAYYNVPEVEMCTLELEIGEGVREFISRQCKELNMTSDEFIMKVLIEQLGDPRDA